MDLPQLSGTLTREKYLPLPDPRPHSQEFTQTATQLDVPHTHWQHKGSFFMRKNRNIDHKVRLGIVHSR